MKFPISYPVDNTKLLHPYVIESGRMVAEIDGGEDYFCIDLKPIEVCRFARSRRCSMGRKDFEKAPSGEYSGITRCALLRI